MILPMTAQLTLVGLDSDFLSSVIRLITAATVGGMIGANRELTRKPAGLRTHSLVALGCALAVVTSTHLASNIPGDSTARVIQGVVAGIGFLGGGVIVHAEGRTVRGLTTAATIWVAAAAGIACGIGAWGVALVAVIIALLVLTVGQAVENALHRMRGQSPDDDDAGSKQ